MVEIAVRELERVFGARSVSPMPERVCTGCVIDSREVVPDAIFVAFPGERVDGNAFAAQAVEAGAAAVVLTREPASELVELAAARACGLFVADDATAFLLRLAAWVRERLGAQVVGITGSIGKTTTKDALAALLATRYRVHATRGNYNNLIGLPLTILSAPADTEVLVLEMGMNHPGEIARLAACARPSIGVITKVGTSHIGILGSRENIARAKAEIVEGLAASADGVLVLHGEDDFSDFIADQFAAPAGVSVLRCGAGAGNDVTVSAVEVGQDGCPRFDVELEDASVLHAQLPVLGAQAVPNAVFAIAVAARLGVTVEQMAAALASMRMTGRRTQIRQAVCGARVIDDTYNASPESMAAGLDLLASLPCSGARVAILGEMGELGEMAAHLHGLTGAYAAAKKPDVLVFVGGEMARAMAEAARLMGMDEDRMQVVASCEELLARADGLMGPDDLALVKASRFVGLDRFVEGVCADAR